MTLNPILKTHLSSFVIMALLNSITSFSNYTLLSHCILMVEHIVLLFSIHTYHIFVEIVPQGYSAILLSDFTLLSFHTVPSKVGRHDSHFLETGQRDIVTFLLCLSASTVVLLVECQFFIAGFSPTMLALTVCDCLPQRDNQCLPLLLTYKAAIPHSALYLQSGAKTAYRLSCGHKQMRSLCDTIFKLSQVRWTCY